MIGNALTRVQEPTTSWVRNQKHLISPSRLAVGGRAPYEIMRAGGLGAGELVPLPINPVALMVPGAQSSLARYGFAGAAVAGALLGLMFGEEGHKTRSIIYGSLGGAMVGGILAGLALRSSALTELMVYVRQKGAVT